MRAKQAKSKKNKGRPPPPEKSRWKPGQSGNITEETVKLCSQCHIAKPLEEFYPYHKLKLVRYYSYCKSCCGKKNKNIPSRDPEARRLQGIRLNKRNSLRHKERYERERDKRLVRSRLYSQRPEIKKARRLYLLSRMDRDRELERIRYQVNPYKKRLSAENWRQQNREARRLYDAGRGARMRSAPHFTVRKADWLARLQRVGYCCVYCGGQYETRDHLVAIRKGGHHCLENLVPCCSRCNYSKQDKAWLVWFGRQAFFNKETAQYLEEIEIEYKKWKGYQEPKAVA